ncbi:MAG: DUF3604 domain-containing protein [Okeania sp. SIO3I5]|uniref:DUF3604 domain-containing protein n=1 Tax=Okeania sp. SIO3I5 TaxID=2607805 RepID=UPI0013B97651|nr:DUF3604 domain-containing protein [Okeania sp. SIO3I5]NEQ36842.1 DUF3604 domain-containing protein [Okeania sp. SIO3I5]
MKRTFSQVQRLLAGLCTLLFVGSIFLAPNTALATPSIPGEYDFIFRKKTSPPVPEIDCRFDPNTECYSPNVEHPQQVLWGDTHLHTIYSFDAGSAGTRLTPADSYEFAKGNEVTIDAGQPVKLSRPLDFLVVTDHSDGLGAFGQFLYNPPTDCGADQEMVNRWHEMTIAGGDEAAQVQSEITAVFGRGEAPLCMFPSAEEFQTAWQEIVDAAETYNDPGNFTAVIGYEWTSVLGGNNLHRNIIYRDNGDKAKQLVPYTTDQSTNPEDLWNWMQAYEDKTGGDVLAIPHNGNLSNGLMFAEFDHNGNPLTKDYAQRRQLWEPLYEVTQIKGTSETHPEISPDDEFADFEVAGWEDGNMDMSFKKPSDPEARKAMREHEYARPALKNGLKLEASLGVNPFKFGLEGASDSHMALSAVEENSYMGKYPNEAPSAERAIEDHGIGRLGWNYGSSGFIGVWATENTRKALFDAMERREVYGTTGPRMTVRFFGGWNFTDSDLDPAPELMAQAGYDKGVPMGSDLPPAPPVPLIYPAPEPPSPTFMVAAQKDSNSYGANLDRIQIVKGWLNDDGTTEEKIFDVAWSGERTPGADGKVPAIENTVDTETATWDTSSGTDYLAEVWTDPDFDSTQRAFYYARVLEIPTPRWTDYDKAFYGDEWCTGTNPEEGDLTNCDGIPLTLQERAYTSPIWYSPATVAMEPTSQSGQTVENVSHEDFWDTIIQQVEKRYSTK